MPQKEWFATWFDSPYYHLLYQHRDDNEALLFLNHLIAQLALASNAHVLDLACGKGRHSITLAQKGFSVVGADLAANSIAEAEQSRINLGLENLRFVVHDMRTPIADSKFDAIFNLFTSFGYFETLDENHSVCQSIHQMLDAQGVFVLDFLNATRVISNLVTNEVVQRGSIAFHIDRWHNSNHIYKKIKIVDSENQEHGIFVERVQALGLDDFERLFGPYFQIVATYGAYDLSPFDRQSSDRLILIVKKKA